MSAKNYLVIIPARAGSKGLPGKNIKLLAGKPMIQHTIEAALEVFDSKDICISTDDSKVIEIARSLGVKVPFVRPSHLASDTASSQDVIKHAINYYKAKGHNYDAIVLLQPTSPLRTSIHIKEALDLYHNHIDMVVSVKEAEANPYYVLFEEDDNGYLKKSKDGDFTRRQDCPKVWEYNGAIYIINARHYESPPQKNNKIIKYEMSKMSSFDVDTALDFRIVSMIFNDQ